MNYSEVDILLVENSQGDIDVGMHALRPVKLGDNISFVRNGNEAADYLFCRTTSSHRTFERPPKLVLLDFKLPKVNGLPVVKTIKGDPRTQPIPVFIVTSSREQRDIVHGYQSGVIGYIQKPLEFWPLPRSCKYPGPVLNGRQTPSGETESTGDERGKP